MKVMRTRVLAVLLSIPLAAAGATGAVLHVCQSMGAVASHGCDCAKQAHHRSDEAHGHHHAAHASKSVDKVQAQPCCTVEISDASAFVATHEAASLQIDDASSVFASVDGSSAPSTRWACDPQLLRERAPPDTGDPPLFVRHCAFLN